VNETGKQFQNLSIVVSQGYVATLHKEEHYTCVFHGRTIQILTHQVLQVDDLVTNMTLLSRASTDLNRLNLSLEGVRESTTALRNEVENDYATKQELQDIRAKLTPQEVPTFSVFPEDDLSLHFTLESSKMSELPGVYLNIYLGTSGKMMAWVGMGPTQAVDAMFSLVCCDPIVLQKPIWCFWGRSWILVPKTLFLMAWRKAPNITFST
jgi:hypothetical protein